MKSSTSKTSESKGTHYDYHPSLILEAGIQISMESLDKGESRGCTGRDGSPRTPFPLLLYHSTRTLKSQEPMWKAATAKCPPINVPQLLHRGELCLKIRYHIDWQKSTNWTSLAMAPSNGQRNFEQILLRASECLFPVILSRSST